MKTQEQMYINYAEIMGILAFCLIASDRISVGLK